MIALCFFQKSKLNIVSKQKETSIKLQWKIDPIIGLAILVITAIITITLKIYVDIGIWEIQYKGSVESKAPIVISLNTQRQVPGTASSAFTVKKPKMAPTIKRIKNPKNHSYKNVSDLKQGHRSMPSPNGTSLLCDPLKIQNMISTTEISKRLENSPRRICNCSWAQGKPDSSQVDRKTMMAESTCSDEATLLGPFQNVISFSMFKPQNGVNSPRGVPNYYMDIIQNFKLIKELYPDWVMRIYSDIPLEGEMCDVVCSSQDIYYCDTGRLPLLGDIRHINPRTWRFVPLGDGTVAKFAVRDLDSRLSKRERDAVQEWENSNFAFHGMRDHIWHAVGMMGGLWGGDNYKLCHTTGQKLRAEILNHFWVQTHREDDQKLLEDVIYLKYKTRILPHDSYLCEMFNDSFPFPTRRPNDHDFVGAYAFVNYQTLQNHCPVQCRPKYGLNWDYC